MSPFERALVTSYRFSIVTFPHLHEFQRYCHFCAPANHFFHPSSPQISPCSPGSRWMIFGLRRTKALGYLSVQLVSKISNLRDPDPPTSQTERQTDRRTDGRHVIALPKECLCALRYRVLHCSASRGKNKYEIMVMQICKCGPTKSVPLLQFCSI